MSQHGPEPEPTADYLAVADTALWFVEGEESTEAGGGLFVIYVLTDHTSVLPDVNQAYDTYTERDVSRSVYRVNHVRLVGYNETDLPRDRPSSWCTRTVLDQRVRCRDVIPIHRALAGWRIMLCPL